MDRYQVTSTVTRRYIVYAESQESARGKVERHVRHQGVGTQGDLVSLNIDDVKQLPPIETEAKGPEVDGMPPRETRS